MLAEHARDAAMAPLTAGTTGSRRRRSRSRSSSHRAAARRRGAQQQHPGAERAGHAGREQPVPRYQVDVEGGERAGRGGPGAGPCPSSTNVRPRRASKPMTGTSPPGPYRCGSTTCSTSPAATAASNALPPLLQHGQPGRRGKPVGRGHHAERAGQLGPRGELAGSRHVHRPSPFRALLSPSSLPTRTASTMGPTPEPGRKPKVRGTRRRTPACLHCNTSGRHRYIVQRSSRGAASEHLSEYRGEGLEVCAEPSRPIREVWG